MPLFAKLLDFAQPLKPSLTRRNIAYTPPAVLGSGLLKRLVKIERNQLEQLLVFQFGQEQARAAFEQIRGKLLLRFDHVVDFIFDRPPAHELVHQYVLVLSNAKSTVRGLILNRRIPPAVEMHDVGGGRKVQPCATRFERKHEKSDGFVFLEPAHQILAILYLPLSVKNQTSAAVERSE